MPVNVRGPCACAAGAAADLAHDPGDRAAAVRSPDRKNSYFGFVDPSGGAHDAFTLVGIGHKGGKTAILDLAGRGCSDRQIGPIASRN
jgi:hypothetical protein